MKRYKIPVFKAAIVGVLLCMLAAVCFFATRNSHRLVVNPEELPSEIITSAVFEQYTPTSDEVFRCESHKILAAEAYRNTLTAYMLVGYDEYLYENSELDPVFVSYQPVALTWKVKNGDYVLKEYWTPDRHNYTYSLKEKFPENTWKLWDDTITSHIKQQYDRELSLNSLHQAEEHFGLHVERYQMPLSDSNPIYPLPMLTLREDTGRFEFEYANFSYISNGTYEITDNLLTAKTDGEDPWIYYFEIIDENTFRFLKDQSKDERMKESTSQTIPNKAEFKRITY